MAGRDLRDFIDDLEERNELQRIKAEVDWNEELGAITREVSSQFGPALLFENITGHKNTLLPPAVYQRHRQQEAHVLDPRRGRIPLRMAKSSACSKSASPSRCRR